MSHDTFHLFYLIGLGIIAFVVAFREKWISSRHDREATQVLMENTLPVLMQDMMSEREFWNIIHRSASVHGDLQEQIKNLELLLYNLPRLEIVAFNQRFHWYRDKLNRWDLWGAIYLLNGGCSRDAFADFRSWLVGQGRQKVEVVLQNPEAIIDFVKPGQDWEGLQYCANRIYNQKTGDVLMQPFWKKAEDDQAELENSDDSDLWTDPKDDPAGEEWNAEDLPSMFPNIARMVTKIS
jgi:hypothetical protein